ncbi:nitric oxide reductase activation protein NorD [Phaeobacter inhibens]|uniref:nitric oxide reductase activation protein NorD n=1 Tax=Phaeobacter inhibens TaxID=221822 RepID=UPI0021A3A710|nr:VWA domain-containing protein [Phaeobacter inhibens]UWR58881.1 VWA domain-containing protein [Phaeobacter inhibens]
MKLLDLMEPEETVGNLWHDMASNLAGEVAEDGATLSAAACRLQDLRPSLAVLFRALGGAASVDLVEAPATVAQHRRSLTHRVAADRMREFIPCYDGRRLALPPVLACFPHYELNRATYFWLVAQAAVAEPTELRPQSEKSARATDLARIRVTLNASRRAAQQCLGLRETYQQMASLCLQQRKAQPPHAADRLVAEQVVAALSQDPWEVTAGQPFSAELPTEAGVGRYLPFAPVPFWLRFEAPGHSVVAAEEPADQTSPLPTAASSSRKLGARIDQDQARRKDSFILHRFESILSWVESMNINRSVDDDDPDNAQKAAEDQDLIPLTKHDRRLASRLRLHLDLSPADAEHERLSAEFTYPEWNHRSQSEMADHCRVLEAAAQPDTKHPFRPDLRQIRMVRRQFEALRPRRILQPRQVEGAELDLDAVISNQADLAATGRGSDRLWQSARQQQRDLSVAFLIDTSRSTEAAIADSSVIEIARNAMAALAFGIDVAGDRLAIWGFSSLRRDRVFLTRCKGFDMPMSDAVTANIGALQPGHYTRLGAAIRHVSTRLAAEPSSRKLLIVLTDGKPNDLDHYEGQHGIEDSRMAVRSARSAGQSLHGIIIDEDGQDWFARIFGRGGFSLLPNPARLSRALPDIYRSLTQEN